MNCNKIKQMKLKTDDIVEAVKDSTQVELSKDHKKIRRTNNAALPKKEERKRDTKAKTKEESKNTENGEDGKDSDVERDEKGNIVLTGSDFENP